MVCLVHEQTWMRGKSPCQQEYGEGPAWCTLGSGEVKTCFVLFCALLRWWLPLDLPEASPIAYVTF